MPALPPGPVRTVALIAIVALLVSAMRGGPDSRVFEEITVQRINIIEPDGTPRMVLASKARFPGLVLNRKEYPHPNRTTAGMLFFNDDGSEQGGLIFGGTTDSTGKVDAYGHLSFDQYEQDQVITMNATESGPLRRAGISVWDRPDWSMEELVTLVDTIADDQRQAAVRAFFAERGAPHPRMYIGKSQDGSVSVRLNDRDGNERLVMEVSEEGVPVIRMLDAAGEVVARFPGE